MKELEPNLIEFEIDDIIKAKNYLSNCEIEGENFQIIIDIIYDKYIYLLNDDIYKV